MIVISYGVSEVRWEVQGDFEDGSYHIQYSGGESAELKRVVTE